MTDLAQPDFTDLTFTYEGCTDRLAYRVFELHPENFVATCRRLHRRNDDEDESVPLLRSHFALSRACLRAVPSHVPWLRAGASRERDLHALREALVEPARRPGLICVDFMDYAFVLHHGGEIRLWRASGANAAGAATKLIRKIASGLPLATSMAACCMHIWCPAQFTITDYGQMTDIVEQGLSGATSENTLFMASALLWQRSDYGTSLLGVSRREDGRAQRHAI